MGLLIIFVGAVAGLLASAGPDTFIWASRWVVEGATYAQQIEPARACAVEALAARAGL